ncbi:hypothetical protein B0H17DRAFT_1146472 [Mycena rosella]|uniref:SAP domain-containing protein n=1 Tax=Mycena rosella TaxID=1033263 RepID=A0AAD7G3J1_MYCRO|nr:hypothetical protein B0H17DRAFT_1146472 [Mycena rosella]
MERFLDRINYSSITYRIRTISGVRLDSALRLGLGAVVIERVVAVAPESSVSRINTPAALTLGLLLPVVLIFVCAGAGGRKHRSAKTMPKDSSEGLPFPGEYGPEGFATQYITLDGLTKTELSEHCKTFKQPHSGNKTVLIDRLKAFSKDNLLPGATNSHKGSRTAERKGKPQRSTFRRENLFDGVDAVHTANAPVTECSKDLRTAEEKATILPWVHKADLFHRVTSKYPHQPASAELDTNASIHINPALPATPVIQNATQLTLPNPTDDNQRNPQNADMLKVFSDFLNFAQQRAGTTAESASHFFSFQ